LLINEKVYKFHSLPKNVTAAKLKRNTSERRKSAMSLSLSMGGKLTVPIVTSLGFYFLCIINKNSNYVVNFPQEIFPVLISVRG
jgi:hypothetical protein